MESCDRKLEEEEHYCLICGKRIHGWDSVMPIRIRQWIGGCGGDDYALICEDCGDDYFDRLYDHVHEEEDHINVFTKMYPNRRSMLQ